MTYPLELLRRAFLKGPIITEAASSPTQWAGRTSLNSGSATVTVSTQAVNSDSLISLALEAALPAAYTTKGLAAIAAGESTATVSTTAVYSGQYIGLSVTTSMNQASGVARSFRTNSVVDGVSFAIVTMDGQNVTSGPANIAWNIAHAETKEVKVNTISPAEFFTIGWADGEARPGVAVTVMWEIRKTS